MVDAYLGIVRVLGERGAITQPIVTLFNEASPDPPNRVVALTSPHIPWSFWPNEHTVAWWAAVASAAPYTGEVGESVVDTLLQIASNASLAPYISFDIWAWLKKQPSLPPICRGRSVGTRDHVVRRVRDLGDVEILESYLLLVWSEWDTVSAEGIAEMCTSIREDLGGIGMGLHREVLIERLDHILGQLDRGPGHLKQHKTTFDEHDIVTAKQQYKELKNVLLEVDREALEILTRTPFRLIDLFNLLTLVEAHRIPLNVYLCSPSPISVVACPQHLFLTPQLQTSFAHGILAVSRSSSSYYRPYPDGRRQTPQNVCASRCL